MNKYLASLIMVGTLTPSVGLGINFKYGIAPAVAFAGTAIGGIVVFYMECQKKEEKNMPNMVSGVVITVASIMALSTVCDLGSC
ncbi:MAG: hypothetical protein ACHQVS_05480 [Candidatus Babeliales bacterium]